MTTIASIPPRVVRIIRIDDAIRCDQGHRMHRHGVLSHTWLQCLKAVPKGDSSKACGELVYVVNLRNGLLAVARVDWREAQHIEKLQMSIEQVATFLQLPWQPEAA